MRTKVRLALPLIVAALCGTDRSDAKLPPDRVAFWARVAQCETGSRWDWGAQRRPREGSTYEGGLGFYWATWQAWARSLGVLAQYPHAYQAPPRVQMVVAEYGYRRGGYWGCIR